MPRFSAKYWVGWAVIGAAWVMSWATSPGPSDSFYVDPSRSDFTLGTYSVTAAVDGVWTYVCWRWEDRGDRAG